MHNNNVVNSVRFEFDRDGNQTAGNVIIVFNDNSTAEDIANTMVPVLQSAGLNLTPVHNGLGQVAIGGTSFHRITFGTVPGTTVPVHLRQLATPGQTASVPIDYTPSAIFTAIKSRWPLPTPSTTIRAH